MCVPVTRPAHRPSPYHSSPHRIKLDPVHIRYTASHEGLELTCCTDYIVVSLHDDVILGVCGNVGRRCRLRPAA